MHVDSNLRLHEILQLVSILQETMDFVRYKDVACPHFSLSVIAKLGGKSAIESVFKFHGFVIQQGW